MKRIPLLITALFLMLFSCTDLTDLENRLTDLENRVDVIEKLNLSDVVLQIETMQGKVDSYDSAIDSLQERILEINDELSNGGSSGESGVFWGDILNEANYAELASGNYTKITGRVVVSSYEQFTQLENITFIGSDLDLSNISGNVSFDVLEIVSGSINIGETSSRDTLDLTFPKLIGVSRNITTDVVRTTTLRSLDFPVLAVVGGNLSLQFIKPFDDLVNTFTSLDVPKLTIVALDFEIVRASFLADLQLVTSFIGGDFNLEANAELSLARSSINSIERVEGSIILNDNYGKHNNGMVVADLFEVKLLPNLTYLGNDIMFAGSMDVYKLNGFGMLKEVPGNLTFTSVMMGYGTDESLKFFNRLESVGGDFVVYANEPTTFLDADKDNVSFVDGFEALESVGGDFKIMISEAYGFEQLVKTGQNGKDSSLFTIHAQQMPKFSSLTTVSGRRGKVFIRTDKILIDGMFPVFCQGIESTNIEINIELSSLDKKQEISGGFNSIEHLVALNINSSSYLDDEYMSITNGAFEALTQVGNPAYGDNDFDIEVGAETKLFTFKNYFINKAAEYNAYISEVDDYNYGYNNYIEQLDQYKIDSMAYEDDPINNTEPTLPSFKYSYPETFFNVNIHSVRLTIEDPNGYDHYWDNYAEVKIDETSDTPAFIQCLMKYGNLTKEELNYTEN